MKPVPKIAVLIENGWVVVQFEFPQGFVNLTNCGNLSAWQI